MKWVIVKGSARAEAPSLEMNKRTSRNAARTEPSSTKLILACLLLMTGLVKAARAAPSELRTKPDDKAVVVAVPRTKSIVRWTPRMKTYSRWTSPVAAESSQDKMTPAIPRFRGIDMEWDESVSRGFSPIQETRDKDVRV